MLGTGRLTSHEGWEVFQTIHIKWAPTSYKRSYEAPTMVLQMETGMGLNPYKWSYNRIFRTGRGPPCSHSPKNW